ncbi:MAG: hypothetical protein ACHQ3P_07010 [Candidatus Limnocylindrales bacterium]
MPDKRGEPDEPGLCRDCTYGKRIETRRGSVFLLCLRSVDDHRYRRYPQLPVIACPGHERRPDERRPDEPRSA